ncbi:hypothetical protein BCR37DRAFT_382641 [Protomyces lactucae-debilis]|uniref:Thioredoxin-like fold domain-containing protein n=1 Tax=Protomyces lactucae-debilis TaxID=2754530 RepID=A0A1Y2F2N3_PROLT|nr:uncharacterized protein BCR37DRAFT_382641 [Protomyces lactucae-debilis]ORY77744.1 hypothetical protein BCR37DRAFT_382641 [Protomyces lactucae-debilis]
MALNPALSALRYGSASDPHVIELYLDFVCPFSEKLFYTLFHHVLNADHGPKPFLKKIQFLFRNQVQPWHPSSTLLHEASLAVAVINRHAPHVWWHVASILFQKSKEFYDTATAHETRQETYNRLADIIVPESDGSITREELLSLLSIDKTAPGKTPTNGGNRVTDLLKQQIKLGRQTGIHVSPTVLVNGLVEGKISSSWTPEDWCTYLAELVKSD